MSDRFIIIGAGWAGKTIATELVRRNPRQMIGFVDDKVFPGKISISNGNGDLTLPVLGHSRDLIEIVRKHNASGIVISITHDLQDHLLAQIVKSHEENISVYEMPDLFSRLTGKIPVQHINSHWITPNLAVPPHGLYTFFQNITNYAIGLAGLFFFFILLFPFVAFAIKVNSRGPIFYRQKREGLKGKVFTLLKFRTMTKDADRKGTAWTEKGDNRITTVGRWLRKFRLDELPQFLNVLKGDMAFIGPRPEAIELVETFKKKIPFYEYRYLVRPGITGWAQVNYENTCSVEGALEKLQYDFYWIKNRSFWLDLKIIFKSIKVMLTGFGAV